MITPTKSVANGYGVDVALTRADDLDKKLLAYVREKHTLGVLDLGCGGGGQSLRLVEAGARVLAVDIMDYKEHFSVLSETYDYSEEQLSFRQLDINQLNKLDLGGKYKIACLQRVLHYLPYENALNVLCELNKQGVEKLFIAVTGISSEIGRLHPKSYQPIAQRFAVLDNHTAETFSITKPICVYSQTELENMLTEVGYKVSQSWVSAFGNCKLIADREAW